MSNPIYPTPDSPLAEVLRAMIGEDPPVDLTGVYSIDEIDSDEDWEVLQNWASCNAKPGWATGYGILEAADLVVRSAVGNCNIAPKENPNDTA